MSRFDQEPGTPYAHCTHPDCQDPVLEFATREEMDAHLKSTMEAQRTAVGDYGGPGHSARVTNTTRTERGAPGRQRRPRQRAGRVQP